MIGYRIQGGQAVPVDIPQDGLVVMPTLNGDLARRIFSGQEDDQWLPWTLHRVAAIAASITPAATWWCAPEFEQHGGEYFGGVARAVDGIAIISTALAPNHAVSSAYHEAFHLVEPWLTGQERAILNEAADRGVEWPTTYLDDLEERKARLFEGFGLLLASGARFGLTDLTPEITVLSRVFNGTVGRRAVPTLRQDSAKPTRQGLWGWLRHHL